MMREYTVPATPCAAPPETRRVRAADPAPRPETGTDRRSFLDSRLPAGHARDWRRGQGERRSANSGPQLCNGAIAQSGERLLCTQEVAGSIPAGSILRAIGPLVLLAPVIRAHEEHPSPLPPASLPHRADMLKSPISASASAPGAHSRYQTPVSPSCSPRLNPKYWCPWLISPNKPPVFSISA